VSVSCIMDRRAAEIRSDRARSDSEESRWRLESGGCTRVGLAVVERNWVGEGMSLNVLIGKSSDESSDGMDFVL